MTQRGSQISSGLKVSVTHSDSIEDLTKLFNNYLNIEKLEKTNMTTTTSNVDRTTFKKEYLEIIPEFKGEPELLPRFIEISEKLVNKFYNVLNPEDFDNEYLMSSILSKVKGQAAINISCCQIQTFADLKNALLTAYADKRDVYTLQIEMTELKQAINESPFEFYNKIQKYLNLQISNVNTTLNPLSRPYLIEYLRNYALRILLRGLKEPVGSLMRTKNPSDLNQALNMLTNDFQLDIKTVNKPINNYNIKSNYKPTPFIQTKKPIQQPQFRPSYTPVYTNPRFPSNFYTPNTINNQQPKNVFKPGINRTFTKPTPMSISTRNTFQRPQTQINQNNRPQNEQFPKFLSEELHNIEGNENLDENTELFASQYVENFENDESCFDESQNVENDFENTFLENVALDPHTSC